MKPNYSIDHQHTQVLCENHFSLGMASSPFSVSPSSTNGSFARLQYITIVKIVFACYTMETVQTLKNLNKVKWYATWQSTVKSYSNANLSNDMLWIMTQESLKAQIKAKKY